MIFETFISILAVFSIASSNPRYPSYQYCSDMTSQFSVPIPSLQEQFSGDLYFNDAKCEMAGKLYYNDRNTWSLQDFYFHFTWDIYSYNSVDETYDLLDSIYFETDYSGYAYTSSTIDSFRFDIEIHCASSSNSLTVDLVNDGDSFYQEAYYLDFNSKNDLDYDLYINGQYLISDIASYIDSVLGYDSGFNTGYNEGYTEGYDTGHGDGYTEGNQKGYRDGYLQGSSEDETAVAIFSGIISIALIPINFFLACMNFEVFGINIGAFVSALLTVAIVVIITRMIVSGGNGGGK